MASAQEEEEPCGLPRSLSVCKINLDPPSQLILVRIEKERERESICQRTSEISFLVFMLTLLTLSMSKLMSLDILACKHHKNSEVRKT